MQKKYLDATMVNGRLNPNHELFDRTQYGFLKTQIIMDKNNLPESTAIRKTVSEFFAK